MILLDYEPRVTSLQRGVPKKHSLDEAIVFKLRRGAHILERNRAILNQKGLSLLEDLNRFDRGVSLLLPEANPEQAHALVADVPNIENPRLELFQLPDIAPFLEADRRGGDRRISLEIMDGCASQCTFCCVGAPNLSNSMDYIKILLIAERARQLGFTIRFASNRIDVFHYGAADWGADFGDLCLAVNDVLDPNRTGMSLFQTHGAPFDHPYAWLAFKKFNLIGKEIDRFAIHLFHKEFDGPEKPSEVTFEEYALRFSEAITLLRPKCLALRGFGFGVHEGITSVTKRNSDWIHQNPPWLWFESIEKLFRERVIPRLELDLRNRYASPSTLIKNDYVNVVRASSSLHAPNRIQDGYYVIQGCEDLNVVSDGRWRIPSSLNHLARGTAGRFWT